MLFSPKVACLQDTNMKLMKTQGASDAMQMAHYKLTNIIIIMSIFVYLDSLINKLRLIVLLSWR